MRILNEHKRFALALMIVLLLFFSGCNSKGTKIDDITQSNIDSINEIMAKDEQEELETSEEVILDEGKIEAEEELNKEETKSKIEKVGIVSGKIEVHFIDVGQGDSVLIKQGENSMLIDAGDNGYGPTVVDYLKTNKIETLDYVIATHPHADHIGGMKDVINSFNIGKVIMPNVTHTTKTFENMLLAIQHKGLKITPAQVGDIYEVGDSKFTIIAPNKSEYDNLNNYSVSIKLEYGDNSFVFTGDAETQSEKEMANNGIDIKADVFYAGHHGSDTSNTSAILDKIKPSYVVIPVGAGNKYNHPDSIVINRLEERNIEIYRNDLHGTVIARGDGKDINFEKIGIEKSTTKIIIDEPVKEKEPEKKVEPENTKPKDEKYIGNINSKIFHKPSCSSLPTDKNRVLFNSKEEALNAGHRGCKRCNP